MVDLMRYFFNYRICAIYSFIIQWNLWIADTYVTGKEYPLLGGVCYSEVNLEGFHRIGSKIVSAERCPLFSMSAYSEVSLYNIL